MAVAFEEQIKELRAERLTLHQEATAAQTKAHEEKRGLSAEERKRDDEIAFRIEGDGDNEGIDQALARLTRLQEREGGYQAKSKAAVAAAVAGTKPPGGDPDPNASPNKGDLPTPFAHFGEQLMAVKQASVPGGEADPRLLEIMAATATGADESVGSEGGFLVQTDFSAELLRLIHETGVLPSQCDNTGIGPTANGLTINAVDETSRVDGSRQGGIQAFWEPEAATYTKSKPTYRKMQLTLGKLTGLYYATDELLMDTVALGQEISGMFAEEFGFKLDDAIVRGPGNGIPLGIVGHAGTVSIAKEGGQTAATIVKKNVENMYTRMWARSLPRAVWYINQDCWPQLFGLSQEIGIGGVPVFLPPGALAAAPFGTLLGRPIRPIEQCDTLGNVGDLIFADFQQYKTIDKGGLQAATSIHVQFLTGETAFRFQLRFDGQPKRNAPLTPYKGDKTQSSFLTLANRA